MATSRALIYFIQRRHLLPCTVQMAIRKTTFFPLHTSQASYSDKSITKTEQKESGGQVQVGFAEVVKENTKFAWHLSVIIAGVGVATIMFFAIFRELFSSSSPNSIYSKAVDRCLTDPKVIAAVGEPIKAYGEETRRGRRGHVGHLRYEKNGSQRMQMKFYIQGSRKQGTVNLEVKFDDKGNWQYRYLFVQLKDISRTVIILEDNREVENIVYNTPEEAHELMPPGYKPINYPLSS